MGIIWDQLLPLNHVTPWDLGSVAQYHVDPSLIPKTLIIH